MKALSCCMDTWQHSVGLKSNPHECIVLALHAKVTGLLERRSGRRADPFTCTHPIYLSHLFGYLWIMECVSAPETRICDKLSHKASEVRAFGVQQTHLCECGSTISTDMNTYTFGMEA